MHTLSEYFCYIVIYKIKGKTNVKMCAVKIIDIKYLTSFIVTFIEILIISMEELLCIFNLSYNVTYHFVVSKFCKFSFRNFFNIHPNGLFV